MSASKDEIPGFYRDPRTGKYYRENPKDLSNPSLKKLKIERENFQRERKERPLEITNVLKYLRAKEYGQISGALAEKEYFKMRAYKKRLKSSRSLHTMQPYNIASVDFIKATQKAIFGVWESGNDSPHRFIIGEISTVHAPRDVMNFRPCINYIIDMCEGPANTIVCVYSNTLQHKGRFGYYARFESRSHIDSYDDTSFTRTFGRSTLHSCCVMQRGDTYALGGDKLIVFFNSFSNVNYPVGGRVHTLAFDETANFMIYGLHDGTLHMYDPRSRCTVSHMKFSDKCLIDSCFVDPQQVVVSGLDNRLFKVDLRMKEIVTEYFQHRQSLKKHPVSIVNNMLCATGADNIIRIWQLSGGNPIHQMKPIISAENKIRGWLNGDCNKTLLYYFENDYKKVFEIM